jgi:hypothetical protein
MQLAVLDEQGVGTALDVVEERRRLARLPLQGGARVGGNPQRGILLSVVGQSC